MRALAGLSLALGLVASALAAPFLAVSAPGKQLALTAAEFAALPHTGLTAADPHAKGEHRYAGVPLRDLLARVDAPAGKNLRGAALQLAVLVRGADGYAVVFSLPELDDLYGQRALLLADRDETGPLSDHFGPLRLVVPGDQAAARWVRNVTTIELVSVGTVVPRPVHP